MASTRVEAAALINAPAPRKRKRFWVLLAVAAVVLLPAVIYFGLLAYINFGFMNSSAAGQISALFSSPAHVGEMKTQWLKNLRMDGIRVDPTGSGQPLTIDSMRMEWDLGPMITSGRIRSLRIEKPKLDLKRLDDGHWNFSYNPSEKSEAEGAIEQLQVDGGEFGVEWAAGRNFRLQGIRGTLTDTGPLAPRFFSLQSVLPSLETMTASGTLGPGPVFNINVSGGVQPERDLAAALGSGKSLTGRITFGFSMKHEVPASGPSSSGPNRLDGRIDLENFEWALAPNVKLSVPDRSLQIKAATEPGAPLTFHELKVSAEGIGSLSGSGKIELNTDPRIELDHVRAKVDVAEAQALFKPALIGDGLSLHGNLEVANATLRLPLAANGELRAQAELSMSRARIAIQGLGELPPCNAQATLNWPAVSNATFDFEHVFKIAADIKNVNPSGDNRAVELARGVTIRNFQLDLGKLNELEIGRRLLTSNFDAIVPAALDTPVALSGTLTAKDVTPTVSMEGGATRVTIGGIKLQDLAMRRWEIPLPAPKLVIGGDLETNLFFRGPALEQITVTGKLLENPPNTPKDAPRIACDLAIGFAPDTKGIWQITPLKSSKLIVPLSALGRIIDLPAMNSISGNGNLTVNSSSYDLTTGAGALSATVDSPVLHLTIPDQLQPMILNALRMAGHNVSALVLENYPITSIDLSGFSAQFEIKSDSNTMTVRGHSKPTDVRIKIPMLDREITAPLIPDAEISFDARYHPTNGLRAYAFALRWRGNSSLKIDAVQNADESWSGQLTLQGDFTGGEPAAVSGAFDAKKGQLGPVKISIDKLDAGLLSMAGVRTEGFIKNLKIELDPFLLRGTPRERAINGRISATLDSIGMTDEPHGWDAKLSGKLNGPVGYSSGSVTLNALLKLSDYQASFNDGEFVIPRPPAGKSGSVNAALKLGKDARGDPSLKFERGDIDLAGRLIVAMTGEWNLMQPAPNFDHLSIAVPPLVFSGSPNGAPFPSTFDLHSPAGTAMVDFPTARKMLALCSRMENRAAKITSWKESGTIGESSAGLLEIRALESTPEADKKETQQIVNSENLDRGALYKELARVHALGDDGAAKVGPMFARVYRLTAASNYWVQNPADNRWVLKKELNE